MDGRKRVQRHEVMSAEATNPASMAVYGRRSILVLVNGAGREELASAYDPVPASKHYRPVGDPFAQPELPLGFSVSAACRWDDRYPDLVRLCRYPKVRMELMPGCPQLGYDQLGVVSVDGQGEGLRARTTTQSGAGYGVWVVQGGREHLEHLGLPSSAAQRTVRELAIHEALGTQYFVTPFARQLRDGPEATWLTDMGLCTLLEAQRLVGAKARLFQSVPVQVTPSGMYSYNVGGWYGAAVRRTAWGVRRALAGALRPDASSAEAGCADYLLAMTDLLEDALAARDAVYRLTRSDAQPPGRSHSLFDQGPKVGPKGGDLLQLLHYNTVAMLNTAYALGDNLAWVVATRAGQSPTPASVGLMSLVGKKRPSWVTGSTAKADADRIRDLEGMKLVVACRKVRNAITHTAGIEYGRVELHPSMPKARLPELFAMWVGEDKPWYAGLASIAEFVDLDILVISFQRLVDELWDAIVSVLNDTLGQYSWSSAEWLTDHEGAHQRWEEERAIWSPMHDGLWGFARERV